MSADAPQLPLAEPLPEGLTAVEAFARLARLPHVVFFDSAALDARLGRYSFVAADSFTWIERGITAGEPFADIQRLCRQHSATTRPTSRRFKAASLGCSVTT